MSARTLKEIDEHLEQMRMDTRRVIENCKQLIAKGRQAVMRYWEKNGHSLRDEEISSRNGPVEDLPASKGPPASSARTDPTLKSLSTFSTVWIRPKLPADETQRLLNLGLIERRRPRSHLPNSRLFRLTPRGIAAKGGL